MFSSMARYIVCNSCNSHVEIWNNCRVCDNFDLCMSCHSNEQHPHAMFTKLMNNSYLSDQESAETQELNSLSNLYLYHKALEHIFKCRGCIRVCKFMREVWQHVISCQVGPTCPVYSFYACVCLFHAYIMCRTTQCPVFLCSDMKEFIAGEQLQLQHTLRLRTMERINETYNINN